MLSRFIEAATDESGTVDYKYLRDIILNIVIAGKDTTAGALAWFLYMACKHPEVQEKVREEATRATGASETATAEEFAQSLTDEALNKMHYLHAGDAQAVPVGSPGESPWLIASTTFFLCGRVPQNCH